MSNSWFHYWTRPQILDGLANGRLSHIASQQFDRLQPGDRVWVIGAESKELFTIGFVDVAEVVPLEEAERRVADPWDADWHVFASGTPVQARKVSLSPLMKSLRFISETSPSLSPSIPLGQQLQRMRVLTPETAEAVWQLWSSGAAPARRSRGRRFGIPDGITREDLLGAIADLNRGVQHPFGPSTKFDVLYDAKRYPPKAVVGLAARRVLGRSLIPIDFTGGEASKAFGLLRRLGFDIVRKPDSVTYPEETESFVEGGSVTATVNRYERDPRARKRCLDHYGTRCRVCQMSFEERYGDLGADFIHVHHIKPVSTRKRKYKLDPIADLQPVCPNCHAMVHMRNPPLGIDELRTLLSERTPQSAK